MTEYTITPGNKRLRYWKDIWMYRDLFAILTWRDIAVQYKQTLIGILWAVLRPLFTMLAFTFIFSKVAKLPAEGEAPYALMVFAAMLPWQLFSSAITSTSNSLITNRNLISKIYFPRIIVPTATIGVALVDFLLSFSILVIMMLYYQYLPPAQFLAIIPLSLLTGLVALGPGLILCSLNVVYRDFRYILPFIIQFGLYVSPVGFSSSVIPEKWQTLFMCNPMVGIIDGFRWAVLGSVEFPAYPLLISCLFGFMTMLAGIGIFRRTERTLVDII